MAKQVKLQCMECDGVFYVKDDDADDVVPDGALPGEAFRACCPLCERQAMATLA